MSLVLVGISLSGYGPMSMNPLARYRPWAAVMKSGLSSLTRSYPESRAAASSWSSNARPTPAPRWDGWTYIRLISAVSGPILRMHAVPTAASPSKAKRRRPSGGWNLAVLARSCSTASRTGSRKPYLDSSPSLPQVRYSSHKRPTASRSAGRSASRISATGRLRRSVVSEVRHDLAHLDRAEGDEIRSRLVRDHIRSRSRGFLVLEQHH